MDNYHDFKIHVELNVCHQLGNTGIIVLETCAPKLAKAKKKVNSKTKANIGNVEKLMKSMNSKVKYHIELQGGDVKIQKMISKFKMFKIHKKISPHNSRCLRVALVRRSWTR